MSDGSFEPREPHDASRAEPGGPEDDAFDLTAPMLASVLQTKPWVVFLAVIQYLVAALVFIAALGALAGGWNRASGVAEYGLTSCALLSFIATLQLILANRTAWFSARLGDLVDRPNTRELELALEAQKRVWSFAGMIVLSALLLLVAVSAVAYTGFYEYISGPRSPVF